MVRNEHLTAACDNSCLKPSHMSSLPMLDKEAALLFASCASSAIRPMAFEFNSLSLEYVQIFLPACNHIFTRLSLTSLVLYAFQHVPRVSSNSIVGCHWQPFSQASAAPLYVYLSHCQKIGSHTLTWGSLCGRCGVRTYERTGWKPSNSLATMLLLAMLEKRDKANAHWVMRAQAVIVALHATRSTSTCASTCVGRCLAATSAKSICNLHCKANTGKHAIKMSSRHRLKHRHCATPFGCSLTSTNKATAREFVWGHRANSHVLHQHQCRSPLLGVLTSDTLTSWDIVSLRLT